MELKVATWSQHLEQPWCRMSMSPCPREWHKRPIHGKRSRNVCDEFFMLTLSNGNIFRVTCPSCGAIHRSSVISLHKGQWCGIFIFSLICVWINGRINNREAGDLRRHCAHYEVSVMYQFCSCLCLVHTLNSLIMNLNLNVRYFENKLSRCKLAEASTNHRPFNIITRQKIYSVSNENCIVFS